MLTPVSKPDRPSTSSGKAATAGQIKSPTPPPEGNRSVQAVSADGSASTSPTPTATTTALSPRKTTTRGMATATASVKPRRNTPPRVNSRTTVSATACPSRKFGKNGFSRTCTEASAADSVIVMIQEVATNPSRTRTKILPFQ
jgi:hypothetical protein